MDARIVVPATMTPMQPMMMEAVNMHKVPVTAMEIPLEIIVIVITIWMTNVVSAMATEVAVLDPLS